MNRASALRSTARPRPPHRTRTRASVVAASLHHDHIDRGATAARARQSVTAHIHRASSAPRRHRAPTSTTATPKRSRFREDERRPERWIRAPPSSSVPRARQAPPAERARLRSHCRTPHQQGASEHGACPFDHLTRPRRPRRDSNRRHKARRRPLRSCWRPRRASLSTTASTDRSASAAESARGAASGLQKGSGRSSPA